MSVANNNSESIAPEVRTKRTLSKWFCEHGAKVWWEGDNSFDYPTFDASGKQSQPDLVVANSERIRDTATVLEVKTGADSAAVYDGVIQTYRYWRDYARGEQQYEIANGIVLEPETFAIATKYSLEGRLFDSNSDMLRSEYGDGRQYAAKNGWLPMQEYNRSEAMRCILIRLVRDLTPNNTKEHKQTSLPGIGAVYSSVLDEAAKNQGRLPGTQPIPHVVEYKPDGGNMYWRDVNS